MPPGIGFKMSVCGFTRVVSAHMISSMLYRSTSTSTRDRQPHALTGGQDGAQEIALPAFFDLVALLDLDDAAAPIGHAVRDVDVLNDAWLQPFAQLEDRRLAYGRVDVVVVGHVHAQGVN